MISILLLVHSCGLPPPLSSGHAVMHALLHFALARSVTCIDGSEDLVASGAVHMSLDVHVLHPEIDQEAIDV